MLSNLTKFVKKQPILEAIVWAYLTTNLQGSTSPMHRKKNADNKRCNIDVMDGTVRIKEASTGDISG